MRIVTFSTPSSTADKEPRAGALTDDGVVDLSSAFDSVLALIRAGEAGLEKARALEGARGDVVTDYRLHAPLPVPESIRDCLAFEKHLKQSTAQVVRMKAGPLAPLVNGLGLVGVPKVWYRQPTYYKSNRFSVAGPDDDVICPSYCARFDYELELAAVVGKMGKDISVENAHEHIFGYTIFNDFSARDAQFEEMDARLGPAKGKDFDTGNVFGPCIVTRDELEDPYALAMKARVNAEERGEGTSADMHHRFDSIIAHISRSETLHPGEVIGSGTVGDGCGLEHGRYLEDGDVVELEVEGIGILRNTVRMPHRC